MTVAAPSLRLVPVENESAVVDAIRSVLDAKTPLRIVAGGTWLDAGGSVAADLALDLSGLKGIVEYVPGDLTLTARSGTTLAEIEDATAPHKQWLPLDPFGGAKGTLGATLATASAGPLASSIGLARDVTLGLAFVTGYGASVRGGGRVVKNVAGFDLVRLQVGAWGTLGVLTEASVRLRARPDADETVSLALPEETTALDEFLMKVRQADLMPLAAELLSAQLAERIGAGSGERLLLRLAGSAVAVRAQRVVADRLGDARDLDTAVWSRLRAAEPARANVVRLSRRRSELARLWRTARGVLRDSGGEAHASLERGVVRCWLDGDGATAIAALDAFDPGDARIVERLTTTAALPGVPADRISRALRDEFDPARVLNRGILGSDPS